MPTEGGFEMSECECSRLLRGNLRRSTQGTQRGADRTLGLVKSLPDAVRCGVTQSALKVPKSLELIAGEDSLCEKRPQVVGCQEESCDFIGRPNTESSSAASCPQAIVAEDAPSADRLLARMFLVIASRKPMPDQAAHLLAMRAGPCFQLGEHPLNFLRGTTNQSKHNSLP